MFRDRLYLLAITHTVLSPVIIVLLMELGHTHIMVPLTTWNTIKKHVEILEQKGSEVIEMSQKGCEVSEISGDVKSMMETIDKDDSVFSTNDCHIQKVEEASRDGVSEEMFKKTPMPPTSPPPRKLLVQAHGPFASLVMSNTPRPWRSNAPYRKLSRGSTSSSAISSWDTHECWR